MKVASPCDKFIKEKVVEGAIKIMMQTDYEEDTINEDY